MSSLTSPQRKAVIEASEILRRADVSVNAFATSLDQITTPVQLDSLPTPSERIVKASYIPAKAIYLSEHEQSQSLHKLTRKSFVSAIIDHPEGAVLEYPETGKGLGKSVAHRFLVDPHKLVHPRKNIQYSLGDEHGGKDVLCYLLRDSMTGQPLKCRKLTYKCCCTKFCEFANFTNIPETVTTEDVWSFRLPWDAKREVFFKTLALYTSLQEHGCSFDTKDFALTNQAMDDNVDMESESEGSLSNCASDGKCNGRLQFETDRYRQPVIRCEFYRKSSHKHLYLFNLDSYDIKYLSALFKNDTVAIASIEEDTCNNGYGPLVPCTDMAPSSAKRQFCSQWHRFPNGCLDRGEFHRDVRCNTVFEIFTPSPAGLIINRQILIVCRNPHSHPPPAPVKTPPVYLDILKHLLLEMKWKLADATPRRILLDSGFITSLRSELGWSHAQDPLLANLHHSFANMDHVLRVILNLRETYFAYGTGFRGVQKLYQEQNQCPQSEQYVRFADTVTVKNEEFSIIICMTSTMSSYLINAKRVTIDTSFKRVNKWDEFEIEVWLDNARRSFVVCRAFTTSQSAVAHFELFRQIFTIAEEDTNKSVRFRHIHGDGYETWVADSHKGQGLGLGKFCQWLCRDLHKTCSDEKDRQLSELDPYEHLKRFFRLCVVYFKRNIRALHSHVSPEVYNAMLSLATSEPLPDLNKTLSIIRAGGDKASDWLDDKLVKTKFAIPALYWPASKIPLHIWRASPATTNGNEQAHRSINRDGINLTLLAGVMHGMQYDLRALQIAESLKSTGIHSQDQLSTHHLRIARSVSRKVRSQQRKAERDIQESRASASKRTRTRKTQKQQKNAKKLLATQTAPTGMLPHIFTSNNSSHIIPTTFPMPSQPFDAINLVQPYPTSPQTSRYEQRIVEDKPASTIGLNMARIDTQNYSWYHYNLQ